MGQKTNAISLRLNINRNYDSCWFQEKSFEYSKLLQQDLKIREYIKSLFQFVGIHTGRISIQIFPKKLVLHYFFHDTDQKSRKSSNKKYRIPSRNGSKIQFQENTVVNIADQKLSLPFPNSKSFSEFLEGADYVQAGYARGSSSYEANGLRPPLRLSLQFLFPQSGVGGAGNGGNEGEAGLRPVVLVPQSPGLRARNPQSITSRNQSLTVQSEVQDRLTIHNPMKLEELKKHFFIRFLFLRFYSLQNKDIFQVQNFIKQSYHSLFQLEQNSQTSWAKPPTSAKPSESRSLMKSNDSFPYLSQDLLNTYKFQRKNLLLDRNLKHIELILKKSFQSDAMLVPIKIYSRYKSAQFICTYVCQRIQQNIPFRQIYKQLLLEIKKHDEIQGMRIVCSGRIGGVEMARVESRKYGQTSLHVFSEKIDFATDQAYTLFGLIGVKVWVCFREKEMSFARLNQKL